MIVLARDRHPESVTPENVSAFRSWYGIHTPEQLRHVIDLRSQLVAAHAKILDTFGDPEGDFAETLDGIEAGIGLMDTIIAPTGDAIAETLFIEPDDEDPEEEADDIEEDDW